MSDTLRNVSHVSVKQQYCIRYNTTIFCLYIAITVPLKFTCKLCMVDVGHLLIYIIIAMSILVVHY